MKIFIILAASLFILEMVIAFIVYPLKTKKRSRKNYYWIVKNSIYRFDPVLGHSLKPNLRSCNPTLPVPNAPRKVLNFDIRTDRNGFLFPATIEEEKKRYGLIFCLGDSIAMGSESRHDRTFSANLDKLVVGNGFRCVNASVGGYRAYHQLILLKHKILYYKPKAVILSTGWNDFEGFAYDEYRPYDQFTSCLSCGLPKNSVESVLDHSALYHVIKKIGRVALGKNKLELAASDKPGRLEKALQSGQWLNEWRDCVKQIIELTELNGIDCYLLSAVVPVYKSAPPEAKRLADAELDMGGRFDLFVEYADTINNEMRILCQDGKACFIDLASCLDKHCEGPDGGMQYKKRFALFVDRTHLSEDGNAFIADCIYQKIKNNLH